jgi:hypothetical protein
MSNTMRIIPLAALLSAFAFAGCAAGGGAPSGGMYDKMQQSGQPGNPCPPGSVFQNGQCVAYGGGK